MTTPIEIGTRTRPPRIRILGALAATMLLTGCLGPAHPTSQATAAPLPPADAATSAPDLLANAGLTLPDDATDIEVDLVTFEDFTEVSITRFTAPHEDAITMCLDARARPVEMKDEYLQGYTKLMLGDFELEPGMYGTRIGIDTATARVFITADDPAQVTVLHYRIPSR
ncbi:hypothetical protein [Cellulomonas bogoriensis]